MSTLEPIDIARLVRAADGYLELGMHEDAWAEVAVIPDEFRLSLDVVLIRMEILRTMHRWIEAAALGREALAVHPECGALYLVTSYAVRRSSNVADAKAVLLSGECALQKEAMFFFNVACYECQLENLESAKEWLLQAFALDDKYRRIACEDPDVEALWPWLAENKGKRSQSAS